MPGVMSQGNGVFGKSQGVLGLLGNLGGGQQGPGSAIGQGPAAAGQMGPPQFSSPAQPQQPQISNATQDIGAGGERVQNFIRSLILNSLVAKLAGGQGGQMVPQTFREQRTGAGQRGQVLGALSGGLAQRVDERRQREGGYV